MRGRGLKHSQKDSDNPEVNVAPMRGRGLKLTAMVEYLDKRGSPPCGGVD